jgi:hypothetical protein
MTVSGVNFVRAGAGAVASCRIAATPATLAQAINTIPRPIRSRDRAGRPRVGPPEAIRTELKNSATDFMLSRSLPRMLCVNPIQCAERDAAPIRQQSSPKDLNAVRLRGGVARSLPSCPRSMAIVAGFGPCSGNTLARCFLFLRVDARATQMTIRARSVCAALLRCMSQLCVPHNLATVSPSPSSLRRLPWPVDYASE